MEQLSMFTDPLEEKALATLQAVIGRSDGLEGAFDSYYGGSHKGYSFFFDPRTKTFFYSDRIFNTYKPEPWARKMTFMEIKEKFLL